MKNFIKFFEPGEFALNLNDAEKCRQMIAKYANKKLEREGKVVYGQTNEKGNWLSHDWFNATHTGIIIGIKENPNYINTKAQCIVESFLGYFDINPKFEEKQKAIEYIKTHLLENK
jgi:hypothetical protein